MCQVEHDAYWKIGEFASISTIPTSSFAEKLDCNFFTDVIRFLILADVSCGKN